MIKHVIDTQLMLSVSPTVSNNCNCIIDKNSLSLKKNDSRHWPIERWPRILTVFPSIYIHRHHGKLVKSCFASARLTRSHAGTAGYQFKKSPVNNTVIIKSKINTPDDIWHQTNTINLVLTQVTGWRRRCDISG